MTDRCSIARCRGEADLIYLDHGVCDHHWNQFTADDAPVEALRKALGIEAGAEPAMEEGMATRKKTNRKTTKKTAAKSPKATRPQRVFAIRVTDAELAAIHRAAGPRNATRFIRAVAAAFANGDEAAFRGVLKEAREAK